MSCTFDNIFNSKPEDRCKIALGPVLFLSSVQKSNLKLIFLKFSFATLE